MNTTSATLREADRTVVLFADDAPSVRFLVRTALEGAGYEALEACTGLEALDTLRSDVRIDLLVTDLHMPGLDGLDLVRQTRALPTRRYLPIVMLTTESHTDRVQDGLNAGLTAWIVKPFQGESLLRVVSRALGRRTPSIARSE